MKRKGIFALALSALISMSLAGCGNTNSPSESTTSGVNASSNAESGNSSISGTIKLGMIGPLSGDASIYGNAVKNGIELAIEEINEAGGVLGAKVELEALDDKNDIAEAVTAYNNLSSKGITALLGAVTSKPSVAIAEIAAEEKMPMVTPTGTTPAITTYGDNIFRVCYTDPFQGTTMATFASENLNAKTAAIIYDTSNDYSQGLATSFEETAKEKGITIVAKEGYGADDKDFRTQLTKIQSSNPDVLFVPEYYQKDALIATQAKEIGLDIPMLGGDGWDGVLGVLDESNQKVVNNTYFANHYSTDDTDEIVVNFIEKYKNKYNKVPNAFAALAYDSAYIVTNAIEEAGTTHLDAISGILKETSYDGVTGHIIFDENGDPIKTVSIIKLEADDSGKVSAKLDSKITAK